MALFTPMACEVIQTYTLVYQYNRQTNMYISTTDKPICISVQQTNQYVSHTTIGNFIITKQLILLLKLSIRLRLGFDNINMYYLPK